MSAEDILMSFAASAGFALLFNVPARHVGFCGLAGMLGWIVRRVLVLQQTDPILATLAASVAVSVASQMLARSRRSPVIVFSAAGIIPLVPGGPAYDAMLAVVQNRYDDAVRMAFQVFMLSGAIAFGIILAEVVNPALRRRRSS